MRWQIRRAARPAPDPLAAEIPLAHARLGISGVWRLTHVLLVWGLFAGRVWFHRRCWFGRSLMPLTALRQREAVLFRDLLSALGPTFIKIGQTLATRLELLPVEYLQELSTLQDAVPPFPTARAQAIIARELAAPLDVLFARFDPTPVAAASLGQVYRARLRTGEEVAVKVQRPGLAARIALDLVVLCRLARGLAGVSRWLEGVEWLEMLEEFRATIRTELDYSAEARHAARFRSAFAGWTEVYVPHIYAEYSTSRVLVMEYIAGLKVTDTAGLVAAGHDPRAVLTCLVRTYLKQLLEDGFFHADPHPGNLRVMADGRLAFFDFGMVGRLPQTLQTALLEAFLHLIDRDIAGLVDDLGRLGLLRLSSDAAAQVRPVLRALITQYLHRRVGDIPLRALLFELAPTLTALPVRIPAHFTFILRALLTIEGIGTLTDPHFNLIAVARPYAIRYTFQREGRYWSRRLFTALVTGEVGGIEWDQLWSLAKLAVSLVRGGVRRWATESVVE
jgi:predicted unusual protein kinase regulating ubiquinone biosynthesis (AarF/ABC1/UbiB family)